MAEEDCAQEREQVLESSGPTPEWREPLSLKVVLKGEGEGVIR